MFNERTVVQNGININLQCGITPEKKYNKNAKLIKFL